MKTLVTLLFLAAVVLCSLAASPLPSIKVKGSADEKSFVQQNAGFAFFRTHRQCLGGGSHPNTHAGFAFFRTHRQGRFGATSTWGMTSESGVSGFVLQRTYEDPADPYAWWEDVSAIPCNGSRSYKCTEQNIFPGYISYRVVAVLNGGGFITSEVNTIRIVSH